MKPDETDVGRCLDEEEARLREAIRDDAQGLREAVDELQAAAKAQISARRAIAENPLAWLGGALILGWMIGARLK